MIYSMTAFARRELKANWGSAVWEIRSVNQRYLETFFRFPEAYRSLEPVLRERFRKTLQRGKVECQLRVMLAPNSEAKINVNQALAAPSSFRESSDFHARKNVSCTTSSAIALSLISHTA